MQVPKKRSKPRRFCEFQSIYPEDRRNLTYTCGYSLKRCPYNEKDIRVIDESGKKRYRLKIQTEEDGICRIFKIIAEVKKDLIARVVLELKQS